MKMLLDVLLILIAFFVSRTYQSSPSSHVTYREPCSRPNEERRPCYTGGTSEDTCPGVYRTGCSTSSYKGYGKRPCGCRPGTYRRSDLACVLYEDCTPEGTISEQQRRDMEIARKLLDGKNRLILFSDVNGYAKLEQDICWSSIKYTPIPADGKRHNLTYIETSVKQPQGTIPSAKERNMKTRDLDWYVKGRYSVATVILNAWGGSCLYWLDITTLEQNHTKCDDAFFKNCQNIQGPRYNYTSSNCSFLHKQ
ncbi:uncharacterized protein LOC142568140 isoform X2 [Dermacentor variabilis]|uniref:uncharacterized protein LOC142568140 isoform X2 n=1 Tax=Dermacentor variabilis TaxID=34621 RepID=UPI003F5BEB74